MRRYAWLLCAAFIGLGCNEFQQAVKDAKKEVPPPAKDNYIILLDLSDRILFNNQQQVPKDIAVVQSIYGLFKSKLNSKDPTHLYYPLRDKLKLLIAPQLTTPKSLYDLVGNLRVDLSAEQPDKKANLVDETEKTFQSTLPEVYRQAVIGNNSNAFSGADIWKYFNEDLTDDLDKDGENTLFILTDGYMDIEKASERPSVGNRFPSCSQIINALKKYPDWETKFTEGDYGLLPVQKKFSHLRVVVLQVNPKEEWNGEYSLLTKIWGKWFNEMGVTDYRFIKNDNINEVKETLEKFMDIKIAGKITPLPWKKITDIDSSLAKTAPDTVTLAVKQEEIPSKAAPKKATPSYQQAEEGVPDESDASVLGGGKDVVIPRAKKTAGRPEDSILNDVTPADGFNTGLKKETKKVALTGPAKRKTN